MAVAQPAVVSRQEFMRKMEAPYSEKAEVVRLPFAYTAMDGACVTQAQQIWAAITSKKFSPTTKAVISEWAV